MSDVETMQALERIDRALARIEAVDPRSTPAPAADPALAERHDRLRARVLETIERLDGLIGEEAR